MIDELKLAEKGIETAQTYLGYICAPAALEFGLLLQDKFRIWRLNNIVKVLNDSSNNFDFINNKLELKAHPRVVSEILEKSSWQDNSEIQKMWAGLLTSSLDYSGNNDENIIFIDILNRLTVRQVRMIKYFAKNSEIIIDTKYQINTDKGIILNANDFFDIVKCEDIDILSSEIRHLISLGLIETGFGLASGFFEEEKRDEISNKMKKTGQYKVGLKFSNLALRLFVKGEGYNGKMIDFYKK